MQSSPLPFKNLSFPINHLHESPGWNPLLPWPRGTLQNRPYCLPIAGYPFDESCRKRGRKGAVAELIVEYAVLDIRDLVISGSELGGGQPEERILP